ncbi:MAG: hypothetical protein GC202_02565 [Alphaproteobacteria bacterium]|nr:hypothetical protein [Alphaproteobacteria bacterium]
MLPVVLNPVRFSIALIGSGSRAVRRSDLLIEAGATRISRLDENCDLASVDFGKFDLVYAVGLSPEMSSEVSRLAHKSGCLLNVEDQPELCDFHSPAVVRRGALTFSVSTEGSAPGLAGVIAEHIAELFAPVWATRIRLMEAKRRAWRALGATHGEIRDSFRMELRRRGWIRAAAPVGGGKISASGAG